jgi:hypothetical protein
MISYWFKRYVLFQKDAKLEPLYHFDLSHAKETGDTASGGEKATVVGEENVITKSVAGQQISK